MRSPRSVRDEEVLKELHAALKRADVPGTRLDLYGEPAVYTHNTCTRIRGRYFSTRRTQRDGSVLETGSVPTQYPNIVVGLIQEMGSTARFA